MKENIFVKYINAGKIRNLIDLKKIFHQLVMETHPDAVGSDRLVEKYISYQNDYEAAKVHLVGLLNESKARQMLKRLIIDFYFIKNKRRKK